MCSRTQLAYSFNCHYQTSVSERENVSSIQLSQHTIYFSMVTDFQIELLKSTFNYKSKSK